MLAVGRAASNLKRSEANPFEKREVDTLTSTVPLKWAGATVGRLQSSNQAQMETVKPKDLLMAIKWGVPGYACRPPATSGMGRHLGHEEWHGDAMYPKYWAAATKTYQPLDEQRRPHHIPGHDRLKRDLV